MSDRARILFVAGDGAGAERAVDERKPRRDPVGSAAVGEEPAAKFAAAERVRTGDAVIKWVVRIVGWLLIVGGFYALVDGTTSEAQVKHKADEAFAQIRPSGGSGIRPDLAE